MMHELAEKINTLIAANQTEKAIQLLLEQLSSTSDFYSSIVLRSREYQEIKKSELSGVLSPEELSRRKNKINLDLLETIKNLEEKDLKSYESSSVLKKDESRRNKRKLIWFSTGLVVVLLSLFFIFKPLFNVQPEYLWWKIPGSENLFKLTRLDSISNQYFDVTEDTESHYIGDDVIAYDKTGKKTVILKNYKTQGAEKKPAKVLLPQSAAYWKRTSDLNRFNIYDKGLKVTENKVVANQIDEDLIVYCPSNEATYLIVDYVLIKDEHLHPVHKLIPQARAYWKAVWPGKLFYLYDRGKSIAAEAQSYFEGNDLIVVHPSENIRFRLENYKELQDNTFRPAIIEE